MMAEIFFSFSYNPGLINVHISWIIKGKVKIKLARKEILIFDESPSTGLVNIIFEAGGKAPDIGISAISIIISLK